MTYRINVTPPAVADTEAIYEYLAESSPQAADRRLVLLENAIDSLADFPKRHPQAPESRTHSTEIRHMLVGNYRILFSIRGDTVHILRLRHAAQKPFKPGELN